MIIHHPKTPLEAVNLRKSLKDSLYLLGGTEVLRLGGERGEETELIDLNGLLPSTISDNGDGTIRIGAAATLNALVASPLVPEYLKKAARLCPSFERRNAATIGGNVGARRDDSYLIATLSAVGATFHSITPHGEEEKLVSDYARTKCRRIIEYFTLDTRKKCFVKRLGLTSTSHAVLIAAKGDDGYALSVKGSPLLFSQDPKEFCEVEFVSTLEGSAAYKKYLASVVFEEVK